MKATLEFDAEDFYDRERLDAALKADQYIEVLRNVDEAFRKLVKYEDLEWAQLARDILHRELGDLDIG